MPQALHLPAAYRIASQLGLSVYNTQPGLVTVLAPSYNGHPAVKGFVMRGLGTPTEREVILEMAAVAKAAGHDPEEVDGLVAAAGY